MIRGKSLGLCAGLTLFLAGVSFAQVKERWRLEWKLESDPRIYTHRFPGDTYVNYWYFSYSVKNNTLEPVPLMLDALLYVETGTDMQPNVAASDPNVKKAIYEKDIPYERPHEPLKFGRFYANAIAPAVEYDIIIHDLRIGNRPRDKTLNELVAATIGGNRGIQEESILAFKRQYYYLNPRELRIKNRLLPGEQVHCLAIFEDVDPRANVIEVHIAGLIDPTKVIRETEDEVEYEFEPHVLKLTWEFLGDPYHREQDVLWFPPKKEWVIKRVGPIASRETIDSLLRLWIDYVNREFDWRREGKKPEEMDALRHQAGVFESDVRSAARAVIKALGLTDSIYQYDFDKTALENKAVLDRIHTYWISYRDQLAYDPVLNKYVIADATIPGVTRKRDE